MAPPMNLPALVLAGACSLSIARGAPGPTGSSTFDIRADWVSWDDSTWTLKSTKPQPGIFTAWLPQSNGYFGLAQGSLGPFYERSRRNDSEGWPSYSKPRRTFATVTGFWGSKPSTLEPGELGESLISGVPHLTDLLVEACGSVLDGDTDVSEISEFESTLSFKTGILRWSYVWSPPGCAEGRRLAVSYESFASLAERRLAAVKLVVSSEQGLDDVHVVDVLDGQSALRTTAVKTLETQAGSQVVSAVSPEGVGHVMAYVLSSTLGDELLPAGDRGDTSSGDGHTSYLAAAALDGLLGLGPGSRPCGTTARDDAGSGSATQRYRLQRGLQSATVYKYAGIASSEHYGADTGAVVAEVVAQAASRGYGALRHEHSAEVGRLMGADFVADFGGGDDGDDDDDVVRDLQITAIASAYYLYTSLMPYSAARDEDPRRCVACNSLAVGGLVSQAYGGKIFWDADLFVAPAVQGVHPRLARQVALYRINRAAQARRNTRRHELQEGSMLYAWTSGRHGQCYNASAPCIMYQYHLNADIALSMAMGRNTSGDRAWFDQRGARDVVEGVALGLSDARVLTRRHDTGRWGIDVMADADEYYMWVADGSFTGAAVSTLLQLASEARRGRGAQPEPAWADQMAHMAMPTSADGAVVLEFRGMTNDVVPKQADVILAHYPYDFRRGLSPDHYRAAMDYYAVRTDPHGPAMTWSVYAIAANALATSGCAFWTFLVMSFRPYVRGPWYQLSEQHDDEPGVPDPLTGNAIHPAFPFLTAHGGLLQVLTAGFLGLRVTGPALRISPSLPPQLRSFRPPVQFYNGAVVSFRMNRTHTRLTRRDASLFDGLAPDQYGRGAMPVAVARGPGDPRPRTVWLRVNESAVVENRRYHAEPTAPGNVLQCRRARSSHGGLALAATDGYAGTAWQPAAAAGDGTAALVVDLGPPRAPRVLRAVRLDFAMRPPRHVRVSVSNSSAFEPHVVLADQDVAITRPWVPDSPVVRYVGNTTTIQLPGPAWSGAFARLEVTGCWAGDGAGATVAEFELLAADPDLHE